ncbi:MAG TPA: peptide chain release factor N(5)-glutamine methyltransferase [Dehalococcoidia bacterium]|nr:peptide chain release factor N(5)-glutamine methyltransferase [Dehalococcoidia bacterium]
MTTVAEAIGSGEHELRAAGVDDARLEAELLLALAEGVRREQVIAALHEAVEAGVEHALSQLLARRVRREPLAYITGHREFYGIDFICRPGALIPRPETELLVDLALDEVRAREGRLRIVDVGTGTGAIACAIAANAPDVRVLAVDSSPEALAIARENVGRLALGGRVELRQSDLLDGAGRFDVIVANLPYVSEREWAGGQPEVRDFEPKEALVPGPAGTEANLRLLEGAGRHVRGGAMIALEIGAAQGRDLRGAARRLFPAAQVSVMKDLAGLDRVLVVRLGDRRD